MDRFPVNDKAMNQSSYTRVLELLGEIRAGISWERLCFYAVEYFDTLIEMMMETEEARAFLGAKGIDRQYVQRNLHQLLHQLHFNRDNDFYITLGLPHNATQTQINKRWKDLMLLYHPDKRRNNDPDFAEAAKKINEAYSVLKDPAKRSAYDDKLGQTAGVYHYRPKKRYHPAPQELTVVIPPRVRKLLPKVIIPLSGLVSAVILLIVYLENRPHAPSIPNVAQTSSVQERSPQSRTGETQLPPEVSAQKRPGPEPRREEPPRPVQPRSASSDAGQQPRLERETKAGAQPAETAEARKHEEPKKDRPQSSPTTVSPEKPDAPQAEKIAQTQADKSEAVKSLKQEAAPQVKTDSTAAKAEPPPVPAPKPHPVSTNLEHEVVQFIGEYVAAYERGDINAFMHLYAPSAVEKGTMNYSEIRKAYQRNFEGKRYRYMIKDFRFQEQRENIAVTGMYIIRRVDGGGVAEPIQGTIRWTLAREKGTLKIVRVDYDRS